MNEEKGCKLTAKFILSNQRKERKKDINIKLIRKILKKVLNNSNQTKQDYWIALDKIDSLIQGIEEK